VLKVEAFSFPSLITADRFRSSVRGLFGLNIAQGFLLPVQ